jgi:hypothetical protein
MNHVTQDSFDDGKTDDGGTIEPKGITQPFWLPGTTDIRFQSSKAF